jgi:hypothetical protein
MKVITTTTRLRRASLGSVVREVATRPFSGALGFSFRIFLGACWGIASETAAVFPMVTLTERRGISVMGNGGRMEVAMMIVRIKK